MNAPSHPQFGGKRPSDRTVRHRPRGRTPHASKKPPEPTATRPTPQEPSDRNERLRHPNPNPQEPSRQERKAQAARHLPRLQLVIRRQFLTCTNGEPSSYSNLCTLRERLPRRRSPFQRGGQDWSLLCSQRCDKGLSRSPVTRGAQKRHPSPPRSDGVFWFTVLAPCPDPQADTLRSQGAEVSASVLNTENSKRGSINKRLNTEVSKRGGSNKRAQH